MASELHIELARDNREPLSPGRAAPKQRRGAQVLVGFLLLHVSALLSELVAMFNFLCGGNYSMMGAMATPLLLSGLAPWPKSL